MGTQDIDMNDHPPSPPRPPQTPPQQGVESSMHAILPGSATRRTDPASSRKVVDNTITTEGSHFKYTAPAPQQVPLPPIAIPYARVIAAEGEAYFILPYGPPIPTFLFTLNHITIEDQADAQLVVEATKEALTDLPGLPTALDAATKDDADKPQVMSHFLAGIEAHVIRVSTNDQDPKITWNIYCMANIFASFCSYQTFITTLRSTLEEVLIIGKGRGIPHTNDKLLSCRFCKGADHPTHRCHFNATNIPGWLGPPPDKAAPPLQPPPSSGHSDRGGRGKSFPPYANQSRA
ncbi:hypothetical protein NP233_g12761 [Leucocoprinus birnbaumii]|uniref:Uncharacterized protein n=1 Tax=Leucocoprinus birnbaumii TaxID=56174 RepID=A0AAD5YK46_9AGAR|nr:hypothetical protein NP233_g12761 [Leucocoprinus birnbaumii]